MVRTSLVIAVVLLVAVVVFYGVVNNPLSVTGYYRIEAPSHGGGDFYVHLTADKATEIDTEDYTTIRSEDMEILASDRPEYTHRMVVEGNETFYVICSWRELVIYADDGNEVIRWQRVPNPIVLVRLMLAKDK